MARGKDSTTVHERRMTTQKCVGAAHQRRITATDPALPSCSRFPAGSVRSRPERENSGLASFAAAPVPGAERISCRRRVADAAGITPCRRPKTARPDPRRWKTE
jgi:hypothetical protein